MTGGLEAAAGLMIAVAAAHSYLGERYILVRLMRRENLPALFGDDTFTKRTLRFAWHVTSVAWLGCAALVLQLAGRLGGHSPQAALRVLGVTFGITGLVALLGSRGRHLSWIAFGLIAAILLSASR